MKNIHHTSIRLDDETYYLVKQATEQMGMSMNELISLLLHENLPFAESDLAYYRYMNFCRKVSDSYDN